MLELKNLNKKFHNQEILRNVSLQVKHGSIAVLLGSSGVGKSTLLRSLNHLENLDSGEVVLDGNVLNLANVNQQHLFGMVFQQFNLFEHWNVLENITRPLEHLLHKTKAQALEIANNLLIKYDLVAQATSKVSALSGGQKQRLAIARTLAMRPQVICFDEPTSALDPILTTAVANSIQELAQENYIILLATHDISLLRKLRCTVYLMEAGSIVERAESDKLWQSLDSYPRINNFISS